MKHIKTKSDMLQVPHWAIIEFSHIYIPGDARSQSDPGHGYPAHNEDIINYKSYIDEAEWKADIDKLMSPGYGKNENFVAVYVTPAKIKVQTQVTIE